MPLCPSSLYELLTALAHNLPNASGGGINGASWPGLGSALGEVIMNEAIERGHEAGRAGDPEDYPDNWADSMAESMDMTRDEFDQFWDWYTDDPGPPTLWDAITGQGPEPGSAPLAPSNLWDARNQWKDTLDNLNDILGGKPQGK